MSRYVYNCEDGNDMGVVGFFEKKADAIFAAENNERVKEVWAYVKLPDGEVGDAVKCVWSIEIVPNREERKEWKERLYNKLWNISCYYDNISPTKRDSICTLLEKFFWWVTERNDNYFCEMETTEDDRFSAWLVQEYKKERGIYNET